jgi:hydrogenase expression/formation protein HypD
MRYVDEFRNIKLIKEVTGKIREIMPEYKVNIMEVCGTHTQSFYRFGLDKILPVNLRLISGPGCPVCVSSQEYIDSAIKLAQEKDTLILTFGDMLRIPGTHSTLERERAKSGNVHVVYSALDSLKVAKLNPDKKVIFLAVGFETTAPTIALSIISAAKEKIKNLSFLSSLKLIPPAMEYLLQDKRLKLNGFLCPGHVSAIIGTRPYGFIPKKYHIGCCVAGFEPLDMLEGIYLLLRQVIKNRPKVENQYSRVVTRNGNTKAVKIINKVFKVTDANWRGLGKFRGSGLKIRNEYVNFDAASVFSLSHPCLSGRQEPTAISRQQKRCRCAEVLKGLIRPDECALFKKSCSPENPFGPCMVSIEGACNAYYKYR